MEAKEGTGWSTRKSSKQVAWAERKKGGELGR